LIYFLRGVQPYDVIVNPIVRRVQGGNATLVLSTMSELEAVVKPLRDGNEEELARVEDLLVERRVRIMPVTRTLARHAGVLRAQHGFSAPDAIIVATAEAAGCDVIVGNDRQWRGRTGVPFLYLEDMISGR
jgi:uncharacterized protein